MREIKFRAWYKKDKNMLVPLSIAEILWSVDGGYFFCDAWDGYTEEELELLQYTGLKDKNGIEIYEGDILYNLNDRYNYVIIWDDIQGAFSLGEDGCLLKKYCLNEFWEVIGNIYENPELLEGKSIE